MSLSEFLMVTGVAVFVNTIAALFFSRFLRRDAASRDAILFAAICLCLCAPLVLLIVDLGGFSWRTPLPMIGDARSEITAETFAPTSSLEESAIESPSPQVASSEIAVTSSDSVAPMPRHSPELPTLHESLFFLWILGTVAILARLLVAWCKLQRVVFESSPADDELAQRCWDNAKRMLGLEAETSLRVSRIASIPFVSGVFRSKVILPASWTQLTEKQLEDVFLHELMHVTRRDSAKLILQHAAAIIYWPVITVHFVNHLLSEAREEVCDNGVLSVRDAISYGDSLLNARKTRDGSNSAWNIGVCTSQE